MVSNKHSKNKCNFCKYFSGTSCVVMPSAYYCREAVNEYYAYLQESSNKKYKQKSLRNWDKR